MYQPQVRQRLTSTKLANNVAQALFHHPLFQRGLLENIIDNAVKQCSKTPPKQWNKANEYWSLSLPSGRGQAVQQASDGQDDASCRGAERTPLHVRGSGALHRHPKFGPVVARVNCISLLRDLVPPLPRDSHHSIVPSFPFRSTWDRPFSTFLFLSMAVLAGLRSNVKLSAASRI